MTEARAEVSPAEITAGRRRTAMSAGVLAVFGAGGVAVIESGPTWVGVGIVTVSVLSEIGLAYLYHDGDHDLSPHRSRARQFPQPEPEQQ